MNESGTYTGEEKICNMVNTIFQDLGTVKHIFEAWMTKSV